MGQTTLTKTAEFEDKKSYKQLPGLKRTIHITRTLLLMKQLYSAYQMMEFRIIYLHLMLKKMKKKQNDKNILNGEVLKVMQMVVNRKAALFFPFNRHSNGNKKQSEPSLMVRIHLTGHQMRENPSMSFTRKDWQQWHFQHCFHMGKRTPQTREDDEKSH